MEIVGVQEGVSDAEDDGVPAGMILAEDESKCDDDDEITRPARHLRNVVDSNNDGEVAARAVRRLEPWQCSLSLLLGISSTDRKSVV